MVSVGKLKERLEFWLLRKLLLRHLEQMDQFSLYRMKTSFGQGYVKFTMEPDPEASDPAYHDIS